MLQGEGGNSLDKNNLSNFDWETIFIMDSLVCKRIQVWPLKLKVT
mgnify:CR=1 FL=1